MIAPAFGFFLLSRALAALLVVCMTGICQLFEEVAALLVGLRVGVDDLDLFEGDLGCEMVVDGHEHLAGYVDRVAGEPVKGLADTPGFRVLDRGDAVAFAAGDCGDDAVDGRHEPYLCASHLFRELMGERSFGSERYRRHWSTMQSMRVSVIFWPSSQKGPKCVLSRRKNASNFTGSRLPMIPERSFADAVHAASTSGT